MHGCNLVSSDDSLVQVWFKYYVNFAQYWQFYTKSLKQKKYVRCSIWSIDATWYHQMNHLSKFDLCTMYTLLDIGNFNQNHSSGKCRSDAASEAWRQLSIPKWITCASLVTVASVLCQILSYPKLLNQVTQAENVGQMLHTMHGFTSASKDESLVQVWLL